MEEEYKKCIESEEYFYNNYCKKEGMPEYSKESFEKYKKNVQEKRMFHELKTKRKGNYNSELSFFITLSFYKEYPLHPDDVFNI